jgi:CheY-like chemotaxis protein
VDDIEAAVRGEFLLEAQDIVDELERCLMQLERTPDDRALLDGAFRAMHTLKGSSMAAGFGALGQLVHFAETLLANLRTNETVWSDAIGEALLRTTDRVRTLVAHLSADWNAELATDDVEASLRALLAPGTVRAQPAANDDLGYGLFEDPPPPKPLPIARGKARVLFCDDDEDILALVSQQIRLLDIECHTSSNGRAALERLQEYGDLDALLVDLVMPHMDGVQLISAVRERWPQIPIVIVSGNTQKIEALPLLEVGAYAILEKPFTPGRLELVLSHAIHLKALRNLLAKLSTVSFKAHLGIASALQHAQTGDRNAADAAAAAVASQVDSITRLAQLASVLRGDPRRKTSA